MTANWRAAYEALRASGLSSGKLFWLRFPIGRRARLQAALRERASLLGAKNDIADLLFRTQASLARLDIRTLADVEAAAKDPEKRRLLAGCGVNEEMLEEELRERYGTETAGALDKALAELVREGVVLRVPGGLLLANHDILVGVHARRRGPYSVGLLNRLLHEGREDELALRSRQKRDDSTHAGRSYRL
jgi:hypothetical protein